MSVSQNTVATSQTPLVATTGGGLQLGTSVGQGRRKLIIQFYPDPNVNANQQAVLYVSFGSAAQVGNGNGSLAIPWGGTFVFGADDPRITAINAWFESCPQEAIYAISSSGTIYGCIIVIGTAG